MVTTNVHLCEKYILRFITLDVLIFVLYLLPSLLSVCFRCFVCILAIESKSILSHSILCIIFHPGEQGSRGKNKVREQEDSMHEKERRMRDGMCDVKAYDRYEYDDMKQS
jgi:hypothetical protein